MFGPLDLAQVRQDQRRAAALLGLHAEICPTKRSRHSFLPSSYWGKPKDEQSNVMPNFSFIRGDLQRLSLPAISKSRQAHEIHYRGRHPLGARHSQKYPFHKSGALIKDNGLVTQSLPALNAENDRGYRRSHSRGNVNEGAGSERLSNRNQPWGRGYGDSEPNGNVHKRLTIHVPGEDGSSGHATVQKLKTSNDVLPPLVSIYSSVSTSRPAHDGDSHFVYHHALGNDRPNLPHSDSNLSNASIELSKSPPFHIHSVEKSGLPSGDSPVVNRGGNITFRKGNIKLKGPIRKKHDVKQDRNVTGRYQSLESFGFVNVNETAGPAHGSPDVVISESDYSSVSAPSPGLEDSGQLSEDDYWDKGSFAEIETLIQKSPQRKTSTIAEVIQRFQPPRKVAKVSHPSADVVNVHRHAYISALAVARCHQLPIDSSGLGNRFTKPFLFSYFKHIPHQKPCRCAECRERKISNSIVPRNSKASVKLSPIKAIFGKVKIEDYYPRRILP